MDLAERMGRSAQRRRGIVRHPSSSLQVAAIGTTISEATTTSATGSSSFSSGYSWRKGSTSVPPSGMPLVLSLPHEEDPYEEGRQGGDWYSESLMSILMSSSDTMEPSVKKYVSPMDSSTIMMRGNVLTVPSGIEKARSTIILPTVPFDTKADVIVDCSMDIEQEIINTFCGTTNRIDTSG
jgi:hypothetical protein